MKQLSLDLMIFALLFSFSACDGDRTSITLPPAPDCTGPYAIITSIEYSCDPESTWAGFVLLVRCEAGHDAMEPALLVSEGDSLWAVPYEMGPPWRFEHLWKLAFRAGLREAEIVSWGPWGEWRKRVYLKRPTVRYCP